jgi:hypothetical protein
VAGRRARLGVDPYGGGGGVVVDTETPMKIETQSCQMRRGRYRDAHYSVPTPAGGGLALTAALIASGISNRGVNGGELRLWA